MLYQLSYASSSAAHFELAFPPETFRSTEKYTDTLLLPAYTAQNLRLAHRCTPIKH